jgi:hypothetical protein
MTTTLIGSGSGIIDLVFSKTIDTTDETIAFHYGDFDDAYGDGTVEAAAANGRVYANTDPGDLPTKFGTIAVVGTASGQTTYTWTPPATSLQANVLVVAGGGGVPGDVGGGGGAGGVVYHQNQTLNSVSYTIKVGKGGAGSQPGSANNASSTNGLNSSISTLSPDAVGGGRGALYRSHNGGTGGSGGGASDQRGPGAGTAGQGFSGGTITSYVSHATSGGGGAGGAGGDMNATNVGSNGGTGVLMSVFGETYGESGWFAGGGGGGGTGGVGVGGLGGGGDGKDRVTVSRGNNGQPHTGGGGGGNAHPHYGGADGGSGVVLVRYIMDNNLIFTLPYGSSPEFPVPSANYLVTNNISSVNGLYWIKPDGYSGEAFQVYCDLTGDESGIGSGGWMRVKYAADLYTQANPWKLTGGFAYSGDFTFTYTNEQINAMKATASEIRQTLDSYGKGSVGWTYGGGTYMGCKTLNGSIFNSTSGGINLPTNTDYGFNGWNSSGVIEPRGTDPTDTNDQVWRQGLIYLVESGNTYLPILGIYNRDVDAANEERYFPLVSGDETFIWIR